MNALSERKTKQENSLRFEYPRDLCERALIVVYVLQYATAKDAVVCGVSDLRHVAHIEDQITSGVGGYF
jgi:hypothetical protein